MTQQLKVGQCYPVNKLIMAQHISDPMQHVLIGHALLTTYRCTSSATNAG